VDEIISAQRMRFLDSNRVKVIIFLGIVGALILIGQQVYLWYENGILPGTWYTPIFELIVFTVIPGLVYFFASQVDYRLNSVWKQKAALTFSEEKLSIIGKDNIGEFELEWHQIKKVLESY